MRCSGCGARNADGAEWCTQCFARLGPSPADDPEPLPDEPARPAAPPPSATTPGPGPVAESGADAAATERAFRAVDGRVEWRCGACQSWNPFEAGSCTVCGQPLRFGQDSTTAESVTERLSRARRMLWAAAAVGGVLMVVSIVLLVMAVQAGG